MKQKAFPLRHTLLLSALLAFIVFTYLSWYGSRANDTAAYALLGQAFPHTRAMRAADNYRTAFQEHSAAAGYIKALLAEYAGSTPAVDLGTGTTNIAGFKLGDFCALGDELRTLAVAEQDILECATTLTMNGIDKGERCYNLRTIAMVSADAEKQAEATNLLAMASADAAAITNQLSRADSYMRIAEAYGTVGSTNLASQLASTAERLALPIPAKSSEDIFSKNQILEKAALRHLAAGDEERGRELVRLIIDASNSKQVEDMYSAPVGSLAEYFDKEGHFDLALEILKGEDHEDHFFTYRIRRMAERSCNAHELAQLVEVALTIQDEYNRDPALSTLAARFAAQGDFLSARMLQATIKNKFCRDGDLWIQTAINHANGKRINAAFKTVNLMLDGGDQVEALLDIAAALSHQNRYQLAVNTLDSALNIALTYTFWPEYEMIGKTAVKYAVLGYPDHSEELLEHYTAEAHALERPYRKGKALMGLAAAQIELDYMVVAAELLLEAREALTDETKSGLPFNHIAENLARSGQYQEAFNTADMIKNDSHYKEGTYEDLALLFAAAGEDGMAEQCIERITGEFDRRGLLDDLVDIYLENGRPERALALAGRMEKPYDRHDTFALTALHYARQDNYGQAFETTRLITNVSSQVAALVDIAAETTPPPPLRAEDIGALSLIVQDHYPMEAFWNQQGTSSKQ